jgi:hypothetical protein
MAWAKNGSTTLSSAGDTIDNSVTSNKCNQTMSHVIHSGTYTGLNYRLGNSSVDVGTNYSNRVSYNGGADGTAVSQGTMRSNAEYTNSDYDTFNVSYFINIATEEKLQISFSVGLNAVGAANAPDRGEHVNKWANTSNQFDKIQVYNQFAGSGDFDINSNLSSLGSELTPASATTIETGSIYIDTDTNQRYFWNGSSWSLQA